MKKILIAGILVAIVLVSIGIVTASDLLGTGDVTGENGKECICLRDSEGNCILNGEGNCICEEQCTVEQCINQNMNGKCLINNNSNGCCKRN